VLKVLWTEPFGSNGTHLTTVEEVNTKHGEKGYTSIRRFVIVATYPGHCSCLPILTYGGHGTLKSGVHPEYHAMVYSSDSAPGLLQGESLEKKAIKIDINDPRHKLDNASRLNYSKIYTVEHNVKVAFVGRLAKGYKDIVQREFKAIHSLDHFAPSGEDDFEMTSAHMGGATQPTASTTSPVAYGNVAMGSIGSVPYLSYSGSTADASSSADVTQYAEEHHDYADN